MRTEKLEVNGVNYTVNIHFDDREDSTASISKKSVNIRLPLSMNREDQFRQLFKMKAWARNKILKEPEKFRPKAHKEYHDGSILQVGNDEYVLRITFSEKQSSSARIIGNTIFLNISSNLSKEKQNKHVSTLLSRLVAHKRLPELKMKIEKLNLIHFNQKVNKIFFKYNKSNWGSCSEHGNINISTRLLFAPDDVLEYVCIHELAHLIEHNHSDRFWALVEKAMPAYREKDRWLKDHGGRCDF